MATVVVLGAEADADVINLVSHHLQMKSHLCHTYCLEETVAASDLVNGVSEDINRCDCVVCVVSSDTGRYHSVVSSIAKVVDESRPIIPLCKGSTRDLSPELTLLLASRINILHVDSERIHDVCQSINEAIEEVINPPSQPSPSCYCFLWKWVVVGGIALLAIYLGWQLLNPKGVNWPDRHSRMILGACIAGVAEDLLPGKLVVSFLGLESNDYVSQGIVVSQAGVKSLPEDECEKSFLFDEVDASYLMEPVLAAIAMRQGNVRPEVALSNDNDLPRRFKYINSMLKDEVLERGLRQFHLSTALYGTGVTADGRRFRPRVYSLAQSMRIIGIEALGVPGFDYCGGAQNARGILKRYAMKSLYHGDPVNGAVLSKVTRMEQDGENRSVVDVIGVLLSEPRCVISIRYTSAIEVTEDDLLNGVESLWHTFALVASADWSKGCRKKSL